MSSKYMTPISSFNAFLVQFKSPAMMMLAGAWPCDEAGAAALRLRSLSCTNCRRMFVAHGAFHFNARLFLPGARWWPCPSTVWQLAAMMGMPAGYLLLALLAACYLLLALLALLPPAAFCCLSCNHRPILCPYCSPLTARSPPPPPSPTAQAA